MTKEASGESIRRKSLEATPIAQEIVAKSQFEKSLLSKEGHSACDIIALTDPYSPMSDQYRLLFQKVDRICQAAGKTIIAITSSIKGEGKTTTASNLAVVAARDFKKGCLLIDADFKNPSVGKAFALPENLGLVDIMMKRCTLESAFVQGPSERLTILPVGRVGGEQERTLNLDGLKEVISKVRGQYYNILWEESQGDFFQMSHQDIGMYDYVFIDTPPLVPVFDMNLISEVVDSILFVVRAGKTPKHIINKAVKLLDKSKVIGSVFNGASIPWPTRSYQYGYYAYY